MNIYPEQQIERINTLINGIEQLSSIAPNTWCKRPNATSWCGLEVAKHMIIAYEVYAPKIVDTLSKLPASQQTIDHVNAKWLPALLYKTFAPKDENVRYKMKTMKRFEPVLELEKIAAHNVEEILEDLQRTLSELKEHVKNYRFASVEKVRFASAIGPIVRFNVAEACEFILCHNERHFVQMQRVLLVKQGKSL